MKPLKSKNIISGVNTTPEVINTDTISSNNKDISFNESQQKAIDSNEKSLVIQAWPGTWKSATLIWITKKLLQEGEMPENIRMITFTKSGVSNLKDRLSSIWWSGVNVSTFHSYALSIIKEYKEYFKERLSPLSDLENFNIGDEPDVNKMRFISSDFDSTYRLKKIYDEMYHSLSALKTNNRNFYILPVKKEINNLKLAGISPEIYPAIIEEQYKTAITNESNRTGKNGKLLSPRKSELESIEKKYARKIELAKIYTKYQENLKSDGKIDFDDIVPLVVDLLSTNNEIASKIKSENKWLLIDEYQDTNNIQEKLAQLSKWEFIRYVWDEKQAIFQFQWASSKNIIDKIQTEPNIDLSDNYRSKTAILDIADSVYRQWIDKIWNSEAISTYKPLKWTSLDVWEVKVVEFKDTFNEDYFIVEKIKSLLSKWANANDIAVIFRNNAHWEGIAKLLQNNWVEYDLSIGASPFSVKSKMSNIIESLCVILTNTVTSQRQLYTSLLPFVDKKELERFFYQLKASKIKIEYPSDLNNILNILWSENNKSYLSTFGNTNSIIDLFISLNGDSAQNSKTMLVSSIVSELSGKIVNDYVGNEFLDDKKFNKELRGLLWFIRDLEKAQESDILSKLLFAREINYPYSHKDDSKSEMEVKNEKKVQLITAHKSKWLEFDTVFVIKNNDKVWNPRKMANFFSDNDKDEMQDLNLYYVSLTRAKNSLFITKWWYSDEWFDKNPFIPDLLPSSVITAKIDKSISPEITPGPEENKEYAEWWKEYLNKVPLSYSALNKYKLSPDEFKINNILWCRDSATLSTLWGTAVHDAINYYNTNDWEVIPDDIVSRFNEYIDSSTVWTIDDKNALKEKFQTKYLNTILDISPSKLSEVKVTSIINGEKIEWYIDKIEVTNDSIIISDYKTGALKSQSEILRPSEYDYKWPIAQLYFYKLLLRNAVSITTENKKVSLPSDRKVVWLFEYLTDDWIEPQYFDLVDTSIEAELETDITQVCNDIRLGKF